MSEGGKAKPPAPTEQPDANASGETAFVPRRPTAAQLFGSQRMAGVQADAAAAAGQISRTLRVWRKAAGNDDAKGAAEEKEGEAEVSEPGEPAEQEADAVADDVADSLHDDKKGGKKNKSKGTGDGNEGSKESEGEEKAGEEGVASDEKKEAGSEKAPEIGAKLDGIGRKILLADDKKANAAVKRLGNAGQDKQALKDALKKVQHERAACVDELGKLKGEIPKLGVAKPRADQATRSIDGALNSLNDHLTDSDITGAMRDIAGDPVKQKGGGQPWDHLQEVEGAVNSLKNTREDLTRLRGELSRRQIDPKVLSEKLDPALDALKRVVDSVGAALKKVKP